MDYQRAKTDWLAACTIGLGVHWTAQTMPREGPALPFAEAVTNFKLNKFLDAVELSGADYVIFTATHALQMLPCPHPVVDSIIPGRTSERDLIGEMALALKNMGKKFIVYYNHSCNSGDDPKWENAVGYHEKDKNFLAKNLCEIVGWLGQQYGDLIQAWWFDSPFSLDNRGPINSVTTDMGRFQFPWEQMTAAAKTGYKDRLVTYNAGVNKTFLYTDHQDYWAGELVNLKIQPNGRYMKNGLQWHGWTFLDDPNWVYKDNTVKPHPPLYSDDEMVNFVNICQKNQAPICFNVVSFQDGSMALESTAQLNRVVRKLKKN